MADDWRTVEWGDAVRFRVPAHWAPAVEEREGMDVLTFRPADSVGGTLNVLVDERTPAAGESAEAVLQEMALRFVRPDDTRASDRTVEDRADGARLAQVAMVTEEDGRVESHYLWLLGRVDGGRVGVAMFSYTLPARLDGQEPHVSTLAALDAAIRAAVLL
ncbi:MAG TPA: hypothetical protein VD995_22805 [Azospirillum sp.]|nr:hypothetical protein [Azospirillum sp.]